MKIATPTAGVAEAARNMGTVVSAALMPHAPVLVPGVGARRRPVFLDELKQTPAAEEVLEGDTAAIPGAFANTP